MLFRVFSTIVALAFVLGISAPASAGDKGRRCEIKEKGKWKELPEVKSRKECKKKGGKWVKADHDHEHGEGGEEHDHEHEED